MLIEDVAGLTPPGQSSRDHQPESEPRVLQIVDKAIRRARLVVVVDWLAILVLFVLRDSGRSFLTIDQTVETVFSLGVLAVATHAGFRWAQLHQYRSVRRVCEDLFSRQSL